MDTAPVKKDTRYLSLDFWRGLACLMVVVFHTSMDLVDDPSVKQAGFALKALTKILSHLWLGVPIFFVISGYCITAACDSARHRSNPTRQYFIRRFRRIYPPYWIVLVFLFALIVIPRLLGLTGLYGIETELTHPITTFSSAQWLGNATLTEGIRPHLFGGGSWYFLGPAWTLCYEEQFYAICGLLLLLTVGRNFFRAASAVTLGVIAVLGVTIFHKLPLAGFFYDGHWLLFAAGMLVYYRIHYGSRRFAQFAHAGLILAGLAAILCRVLTKHYTEEFYVGFFFALIISLLYQWDRQIATSLWTRPVIYCGIMCYSLYLIHWPVVKVAAHAFYALGLQNHFTFVTVIIPLCCLLATAFGWGFHVFVERRFLNTQPVAPWAVKPRDEQPVVAPLPSPSGSGLST